MFRPIGLDIDQGIALGEAVGADQGGTGVGVQEGDFEGVIGVGGSIGFDVGVDGEGQGAVAGVEGEARERWASALETGRENRFAKWA